MEWLLLFIYLVTTHEHNSEFILYTLMQHDKIVERNPNRLKLRIFNPLFEKGVQIRSQFTK